MFRVDDIAFKTRGKLMKKNWVTIFFLGTQEDIVALDKVSEK